MATQGTATLNFGTATAQTSVAVIGQTNILATSVCEAYMMASTTTDHSADEHANEDIQLICGNIVEGTGFTIYAKLRHGVANGQYTVQWVWA